MALQDPFGYDGLTYSGQEFRLQTAAVTGGRSGVSTLADLAATPQGSPNNTVSVAAGTAIIPATHAGDLGSYEVPNDAALTSPTFAATGANGRWDLLILKVVAGVASLVVVQGTAAGSPSYPSLAAHDNYIVICGVKMPANKSIIDNGTNGTIEDRRSMWMAYVVCTSTTRVPIPFEGQRIFETDTDKDYVYDGAAWVEKDDLGAWDSYTPADSLITVGNGTRLAAYRLKGKMCTFRWSLVLGSTSAIGNPSKVGLPFAAKASTLQVVSAYYLDNGTAHYVGCALIDVAVSAVLAALIHTEIAAGTGAVGTSAPFTWTTNDRIVVQGVYELA